MDTNCPPSEVNQSKHLEIYLAELQICYAASYVRMQTISNYINIGVVLAGGYVAALGSLDLDKNILLYVLAPYPFLILGFLILREDFLNAACHRYIYHVRFRALNIANLKPTLTALGFLIANTKYKMGSLVWMVLSTLRYALPVIGAFATTVYYLVKKGSRLEDYMWISAAAVFLMQATLITGLYYLKREHEGIEEERRKTTGETDEEA